jgi:hypothetical protein
MLLFSVVLLPWILEHLITALLDIYRYQQISQQIILPFQKKKKRHDLLHLHLGCSSSPIKATPSACFASQFILQNPIKPSSKAQVPQLKSHLLFFFEVTSPTFS